MKKLRILIPVLAVLLLGFIFKTPITNYVNSIIYYSPCDTPISYRLGSVDPRFGLTDQQVISDIKESENVWESNINKNLFEYKTDGDIEINFIYDQRQLLTNQINELDTNVKNQQKNLDPEIAAYKNRAAEFNNKMNQLNTDIESWNAKGGAPPDEYDKLKNRQAELEQESKNLQAIATSLNQSTAQYNNKVGELQQTVNTFNQAITAEPEEGEYIYDNGVQTINIYFVNTKDELIHTLAHEFGHSLRIGHNENELSIMYPLTNTSTQLSSSDLEDLTKACEKVSIAQLALDKYRLLINSILKNLSK